MPWLTPDTLPDIACFRVYLPDSDYLRAQFLGAFLDLAREVNWEEFGAQTPEDTASLFDECYIASERLEYCVMPIGTVIFGGWATPPDGFLMCDGAQYDVSEYQGLFDAIGYGFGGSGSVFNVPDMANVFPVGANGGYNVGETGGSNEVALSEAETGAHRHETWPVTGVPVQAGAGVFVWGIAGGVGHTNYAGGGQPHENRPPFTAFNFAIAYR